MSRTLVNQRGFTLLEVAITTIVIGVLSIIISGAGSQVLTAVQRYNVEYQNTLNRQVGQSLLDYATNVSTDGNLPAPLLNAGMGIYWGVNTTDANLVSSLAWNNVDTTKAVQDGSSYKNVRVYQRLAGLQSNIPMYFKSGDLVRLDYNVAVIYATGNCGATTTCNTNATASVPPGASSLITAGNYTTWTTTSPDGDAFRISTLPIQKDLLKKSTDRLDKVRDSLTNYFRSMVLAAAASDTTNWYPAGASSMAGQTPSTTQGCRDGWYDLYTDTGILNTVGLSPTEYGVTGWGGHVQYCRDYDPAVTAANTPPHYAALRIHKNVTTGSNPDGTTTSNNVVLTF